MKMRLKHYPGKAVDANNASTEQRQSNGMGAIYEANWLQAQENMRNHFKNGFDTISMQQTQARYPLTSSGEGVSALSKYQITLEQVRVLDQQHKNISLVNTIKDVNGYRPSTLRRKNRKQYPGWDDLKEVTDNIEKRITSEPKNLNDSENVYICDPTERGRPRQLPPQDRVKARPCPPPRESVEIGNRTPKGLRRSQTVIIQPKGGSCGTLDIKDLRRKWRSKNEINMISRSNTLSTFKNNIESDDDDERIVDQQLTKQEFDEVFSVKDADCDNNKFNEFEDVYLKPKSRMDSYLQTEQRFSTIRPRPPSRTKSVRLKPVTLPPIDYLDSPESSESSSPAQKSKDLIKESNGKAGENTNQEQKTNLKESPFSVFTLKKFKTIPLAKLLKPSDQAKTLPRQQQSDISKNENHPKSEVVSSTTSPSATTATAQSSSNANFDNAINPPTNNNSIHVHHNQQRRQPGSSSSSTNSTDDQFSIPRPRLIVPVHTYARKRRTGNLLKETTIDPVKNGKGK